MFVAGGGTNEVSPQTPLRINIIIIPTSVPPSAGANFAVGFDGEAQAGNYIRLALNKRRGRRAIESISATRMGEILGVNERVSVCLCVRTACGWKDCVVLHS